MKSLDLLNRLEQKETENMSQTTPQLEMNLNSKCEQSPLICEKNMEQMKVKEFSPESLTEWIERSINFMTLVTPMIESLEEVSKSIPNQATSVMKKTRSQVESITNMNRDQSKQIEKLIKFQKKIMILISSLLLIIAIGVIIVMVLLMMST